MAKVKAFEDVRPFWDFLRGIPTEPSAIALPGVVAEPNSVAFPNHPRIPTEPRTFRNDPKMCLHKAMVRVPLDEVKGAKVEQCEDCGSRWRETASGNWVVLRS